MPPGEIEAPSHSTHPFWQKYRAINLCFFSPIRTDFAFCICIRIKMVEMFGEMVFCCTDGYTACIWKFLVFFKIKCHIPSGVPPDFGRPYMGTAWWDRLNICSFGEPVQFCVFWNIPQEIWIVGKSPTTLVDVLTPFVKIDFSKLCFRSTGTPYFVNLSPWGDQIPSIITATCLRANSRSYDTSFIWVRLEETKK